jgi:hypothetical protein
MDNADPSGRKDQETEELLTVIIDELRSIGLIPARQDERIEALSKTKDRARRRDWDSVSVAVGFSLYRDLPVYSHLILRNQNAPN